MRLLTLLLSVLAIYAAPLSAATEPNSFEKSFQDFGKKLDEAKAKGHELSQDAQKEWNELKAKTEKASKEAAENTKETRKDLGERLKGAVSELGTGIHNAWVKLKGEK